MKKLPPLRTLSLSHVQSDREMENNQQKPHAIVIPFPLQGHIIPSVHLAIKLASKGFTITFLNTESVHHRITKAQPTNSNDNIFAEARKSGLDIRYATISDGFPLAYDRSLNEDQFMDGFYVVFSAHVDEFVGNMIHQQITNPPITCLIADTFFTWTSMLAKKYNLVNVSFWTEPAMVLTVCYHMDLLKINGHFACHDIREDTIDYIPGVEGIEPNDLMSYFQGITTPTKAHTKLYKVFEDAKMADFVICNTVQELEPKTISALQGQQPIYAIGPVFPNGLTSSIVDSSLWPKSECTQWLNSKTNGSVLYWSFGSYAHCSKRDIVEVANGLEISKVSFIWVLRPDIVSPDETDVLPVGFEDAIKDRGLIVPWCNQIDVISHPTIGGFLSHCGWNSVLESIWCGVPLLCYPLVSDQFTTRRLVVNDWGIGLNLCDRKPITRYEVAEKINRLMSGKAAVDLRKNIKEVKQRVENALSPDVGSSEKNLNEFIGDVKVKLQKTRETSK